MVTLINWEAGAAGIRSLIYPPSGNLQEIRSFDVYPDQGWLHLLLAGSAGGQAMSVLRYLRSDDGGYTWSEPAAIYTGKAPLNQSIHRGNAIQIAAAGKHLVAVWQVPGSGFNGRGPLATAISSDGGDTWVSGPNPADDANHDDHAFVDLGADRKGRFHLVWLDNRGQERSKGLRYARSADGGRSWARNTTVDGNTCACCWNTLAVSLSGTVSVLYRAAEPRDMALAQSADGAASWRHLGPVGFSRLPPYRRRVSARWCRSTPQRSLDGGQTRGGTLLSAFRGQGRHLVNPAAAGRGERRACRHRGAQ